MKNLVGLHRENSWLKTLFHEGKEIQGFVFYNDNGVVLDINRGWFDNEENSPREKSVRDIYLSGVRNARKIKFENKDNFFVKGIMYIYCGQGGDFELKEITHREKEYDTTIHHYERHTFIYNNELITIEKVAKISQNEKGEKINKACEKLEKLGISLSRYQVEKLIENNLLNL